jgi:hypothetical protein
MYAAIQLVGYRLVGLLVPLAVAVPVTAAAASATPAAALPSAAAAPTTAPLFRPVAALAVDRPVPARLERHRRGLPTAGADNGRARAHGRSACAVAAFMLGMGRSVAAATTSALLGLATRFTPPGRRVSAFLEKLLFTSSEHKFLTAVATSK